MGLEGEFPFGISIIFKGKRAVSFQGWCISMYFWKMTIFLHNSFQTFRTFIIHRGLRSWRMGGSSVVKFFFQATKDTSLHFQPPPTPQKMGNLFIEVTLCLYKGCSIPTSMIIVTSHEFRILSYWPTSTLRYFFTCNRATSVLLYNLYRTCWIFSNSFSARLWTSLRGCRPHTLATGNQWCHRLPNQRGAHRVGVGKTMALKL